MRGSTKNYVEFKSHLESYHNYQKSIKEKSICKDCRYWLRTEPRKARRHSDVILRKMDSLRTDGLCIILTRTKRARIRTDPDQLCIVDDK